MKLRDNLGFLGNQNNYLWSHPHFDNWHPEEVNSFKVVGIFDEGCSYGFEMATFIYRLENVHLHSTINLHIFTELEQIKEFPEGHI